MALGGRLRRHRAFLWAAGWAMKADNRMSGETGGTPRRGGVSLVQAVISRILNIDTYSCRQKTPIYAERATRKLETKKEYTLKLCKQAEDAQQKCRMKGITPVSDPTPPHEDLHSRGLSHRQGPIVYSAWLKISGGLMVCPNTLFMT